MVDRPHLLAAHKTLARAGGDNTAAGAGDAKELRARLGAVLAAGDKSKPKRPFVRVYHGKYFEDFVVGARIYHALTRTVTESERTTSTLNHQLFFSINFDIMK